MSRCSGCGRTLASSRLRCAHCLAAQALPAGTVLPGLDVHLGEVLDWSATGPRYAATQPGLERAVVVEELFPAECKRGTNGQVQGGPGLALARGGFLRDAQLRPEGLIEVLEAHGTLYKVALPAGIQVASPGGFRLYHPIGYLGLWLARTGFRQRPRILVIALSSALMWGLDWVLIQVCTYLAVEPTACRPVLWAAWLAINGYALIRLIGSPPPARGKWWPS
jgi:hypothetical protein